MSENQVNTLKDAIQLKKGATLCFPKGGIRGDHVLLRLDKAQVEGRRVQVSARQVAKNLSYTGVLFAVLALLIARSLPLTARVLPTIMSGLATGLHSGGIHKD